ncbi:MAG TPA: hypothetical protein VFT95_11905 [Micromonosporaceae bacterium]|nr:hypothetical protein [Micromonosporaceae bacterium]
MDTPDADTRHRRTRPLADALNLVAAVVGLAAAVGLVRAVVPFDSLPDKIIGISLAGVAVAWVVRLVQLARTYGSDRPLIAITALLGALVATALIRTPPGPDAPDGSSAAAGGPGPPAGPSGPPSGPRRTGGPVSLASEPNGHGIDLDSTAANWGLTRSPGSDFFVEHNRVSAGAPAQLTEVDEGAGFDTCARQTGYRPIVPLSGRGLREGDELTVCVHTDLGRYAVLLLTVHGDGTSFASVDADIRVWEPIVRG